MQAFKALLGQTDMLAYLAMMAPRLIELHRVLEPTGWPYLHCDPTASHYLKLLLDAIFGPKLFLKTTRSCGAIQAEACPSAVSAGSTTLCCLRQESSTS